MTATTRMLAALAFGLSAGIVAANWPGAVTEIAGSIADPVGRLWVNGLQMTVVPLVVCLLITGLASTADIPSTGRLGLTAIATFLAFLCGAAVVSLLIGPRVLAHLSIDPATAAALRIQAIGQGNAAVETVRRLPSLSQMLTDIIPANPVRAAADGAMLPLAVFAIVVGLAASRLPAERRTVLVGFFKAAADALLIVVAWVIRIAPIGIFALAFTLAMRMGLAIAGAFAFYVTLLSAVVIIVTLLLYLAVATLSGVSLSRFARAAAPAQMVAFSARSSLAALPAMLEAVRTKLALPSEAGTFVLPLAVTTLRISTPIMWAITIPFLALLYGVPIGNSQLVAIVAASILISFSIPGLPSASLFLMAPFLAGLGIPPEALGLVLAVDAIPDLFKGVLNVTGHLAATAIVMRRSMKD